ncbi:MAG: hypothetical protein AAGJ18_02640, partial [Bacteroidota bacterium]
ENWLFDQSASQWKSIKSNSFDKFDVNLNTIGFCHKGEGYILTTSDEIYRFEVPENQWIFVARYPARLDAEKAVFTIDDEAYVFTTLRGSGDMFKFLH